jgi:hypothetical protein
LGLGTCPELASFDLRSGARVVTPLAQCSPTLAPRGPDGFDIVDGARSGRVESVARAAVPKGAVELSQDGATVLRARSLLAADGTKRELAHAPWSDAEAARRDGLAFALEDRLVVGRRGREAWLWCAREGSFLGRIQPLAGGGTLFTGALPRDPSGPETSLLQLFGPQAVEGVACLVGDRQYAWAVCEDRYGDEALLARMLDSAAK